MTRPRFLPDNMTLFLLSTIAVASMFPCMGVVATWFDRLSMLMIALLFFLHGARLSRQAVVAGFTHWRLHFTVLMCTFLLFPLLGLLIKPLALRLLTPELYVGILYLCVLPSTVQSSIAFTAIARGNVSAAVCAASASNMLGIFVTPLLVSLMVPPAGASHSSVDGIVKIILQLLAPFIAGQLMRPWLLGFLHRHDKLVKAVDQSSILLVVYVAFSAAVVQGLWHQLPLQMLLKLLTISALMLALVIVGTTLLSRRFGFAKEDEITIVFCGSKKSLASGVPMAKILFSSGSLGLTILPLMLFHQLQLMVCAVLAQRYRKRLHSMLDDRWL
jgi:sodium/bile acid cotransporter 7